MKHLLLALLGLPLTLYILTSSLTTLLTPSTPLTTRLPFLLLLLLTIRTNIHLLRTHLFHSRARSQNCGVIPTVKYRDPVLGLDGFFAALSAVRRNRLLEFFDAQLRQFGDTHYLLALGRPVLLTNDRDNIKCILAGKMDEFPIAGPRLYATLPVLGERSIFTSNGKAWKEARGVIRGAFVRDAVADLGVFERHIGNLLRAVDESGPDGFDVQELLLRMTMDSSTDFMLGYSTDSLVKPEEEARRFLLDFEFASAEAANRARLGPVLYHLPQPSLSAAVKRLRRYIRFYMRRAVLEREKGGGEAKGYVFLDDMLKHSRDEEHIIDQILSIIVAGRDTTAAAMSAVFYCLARSPKVVERLKREIDELGVENPSWEQLRQMKYLNNIIREALRLFPPVATNSRASNKETILPRGGGPDGSQPILVPKGTAVRWSLYSLHRRKDVFGPDADEFRPERWEEDDMRKIGWEYIPFHGGPRICIGQQFALTQIAYLLFRFFSRFDGIRVAGAENWEDGQGIGRPELRTAITISFAKGVWVAVGGRRK